MHSSYFYLCDDYAMRCCSVQYYYYYKYMRKRINEMHPQLPDAVMDKLLTYDAEELDTLLKYPSAAQGQVERTTRPPI